MGGLNLFYEEPNPDRWLPCDRYPRRYIRLLVRGREKIGGQKRLFINLCAGLDKIGIGYRLNDYRYARRHPSEVVCIIGKPYLLDKERWGNPIVFGAAIFSHPLERPNLLREFPNIIRILVPGEWMRKMCEPFWGDKVVTWPVGIDTRHWRPSGIDKEYDFLLYDKVRWRRDELQSLLIEPIRDLLRKRGLSYAEMRYGQYREIKYHELLGKCRAMIFLCEHETQGIAYQQALSCGVPILAWDRGGYWQDPSFYPDKVTFGPVSSVPYWDSRCGLKFESLEQFAAAWEDFWHGVQVGDFAPRDYILENLTLERCAREYVGIVQSIYSELSRNEL